LQNLQQKTPVALTLPRAAKSGGYKANTSPCQTLSAIKNTQINNNIRDLTMKGKKEKQINRKTDSFPGIIESRITQPILNR
tara:strand:+ start:421 stop:663 length:243 start_codon:yes stop_codon:yes gene_type:complete